MHSRHARVFDALLYALMAPTKGACRDRRLPRADRTAARAVSEGALLLSAMGHLQLSHQAPCKEHCQRWQLLSGGGLEAQMPTRRAQERRAAARARRWGSLWRSRCQRSACGDRLAAAARVAASLPAMRSSVSHASWCYHTGSSLPSPSSPTVLHVASRQTLQVRS